MRIVIFGTGTYYQNRKHEIPSDIEITGFIDNNSELWEHQLDGKKIYKPSEILNLSWDIILLMSSKASEMKKQMLALNIPKEKLWYWLPFYGDTRRGTFQLWGNITMQKSRKKALLTAASLKYDGSSMAAVYAVSALQTAGYEVVLAAPEGDPVFINEMIKQEIAIVICPALYYIHQEELFWIQQFDIVIVNTVPMMVSACAISKIRPVLWWIHECSDKYGSAFSYTQEITQNYFSEPDLSKITVAAVSRLAQQNFHDFFSADMINLILPYGIPDRYQAGFHHKKESDKLIFAVIGNLCIRKAQHIFVEAIRLLPDSDKKHAEFWIIGRTAETQYCKELFVSARQDTSIKMLGEMTREEIDKAYQSIDVVVCPSLEETMSIVVTEGMMFEKVCITTDTTGIADYICDGKNGFICRSGDSRDLSLKIKWIIQHKECLADMKTRARTAYLNNFTMDGFSSAIKTAVETTISNYSAAKSENEL